MKEEKEKKREEFIIKIGPLLKKILDNQKENIRRATYECVKTSDYEAGEILAKKIMSSGGLKEVKNLV